MCPASATMTCCSPPPDWVYPAVVCIGPYVCARVNPKSVTTCGGSKQGSQLMCLVCTCVRRTSVRTPLTPAGRVAKRTQTLRGAAAYSSKPDPHPPCFLQGNCAMQQAPAAVGAQRECSSSDEVHAAKQRAAKLNWTHAHGSRTKPGTDHTETQKRAPVGPNQSGPSPPLHQREHGHAHGVAGQKKLNRANWHRVVKVTVKKKSL
jgi:hypothetical protein